jgi:pimeloyl-ACP methyl ester carboxylesterase
MKSRHAFASCALLAVAAGTQGCKRAERPNASGAAARGSATNRSQTPPAPKRELGPLSAESWRIDLPVEGFGAAALSVPLGAKEARPVVIALHGSGDRADWQCGTWTGITNGYPFVVCPRGVPRPHNPGEVETFNYGSFADTERELRGALRALKRRFGDYVAPGPVVLAGFSLGATLSVLIAQEEPSYFSKLVLIEGAYEHWSSHDAAVFAKRGGQKLLVVCAQAGCEAAAQRAVLFTKRAAADADFVYPGPLGHMLDGRVASAIKTRFAWLVEDDPRWPQVKRDAH